MKAKTRKNLIVHIVLILGSVIMVTPFVWMILTAFKTQGEAIHVPVIIFPSQLRLDAFRDVFDRLPFGQAYINTIISAIVTIIAQVVMCSMAGYAFGRLHFPGRDLIFVLSLSVLMIPSTLFILPQYLIIQKMGLLNTLPALFIPNLFSAFGTFLMRQFYMSLPKELEEAAKLDGCSHFMIYLRIMTPLVKPGLTALAIITLRLAWNDLMWPMVVNTSAKKMTLSAVLANLTGQYSTTYPTLMAGSLMAILPMIILFAVFQRQFIEGIAITGSKG
jgi:multiple sugar transport system permease protein